MYSPLPKTSEGFAHVHWSEIEPWYHELAETPLSEENLQPWLQQWSDLSSLVNETMTWLEISCTRDTSDQERTQRQERFLNDVYTHIQSVDQRIKEKLLESGLQPEGFELPLRKLRTETIIFREENVTLLSEEKNLGSEYLQLGGAQTVEWEGKEVNIYSLSPVLSDPDRERRERVWRTIHERLLADRPVRNEQWIRLFQLRQQIGRNAGYESYRDYRWQQVFRFDYTPADSKAFDDLIEQEIVPVASTLWEKRRQMLGVETLRPWDQKWAELSRRYFPALDWTGLEAALRVSWQKVLHFYCYPLYMIEYGFAAIGALQIWNNYLRDPQAALHQYRSALALGATRSLPELYTAAGANFTFTPETIRPLVQLIMQTVEDLKSRL